MTTLGNAPLARCPLLLTQPLNQPSSPNNHIMNNLDLLDEVRALAASASESILEIYASNFDVQLKGDASPLTQADLASHRTIVQGLESITPDIPILSEESADIPFENRARWQTYWLVDPLDGTKEFIKRNGEFTVNIALIANGAPVLGVVHVPASGICYAGSVGDGAWRTEEDGSAVPISVRKLPPSGLEVAGSRSHNNEETTRFVDRLRNTFGSLEMRSIGSSLKFCLVAEGAVDIYPRFGPTSEWDTGAAQAVVEAAGGKVVDTTLKPLRYNTKESVLNPHFLVFGDDAGNWGRFLN